MDLPMLKIVTAWSRLNLPKFFSTAQSVALIGRTWLSGSGLVVRPVMLEEASRPCWTVECDLVLGTRCLAKRH